MKDIVLAVDDIKINRILLKKILADKYEVAEAGDGLEALEFLKTTPRMPSIILLDINMPNMDGIELIKRLKEKPETKQIPILFITSEEGNESEAQALHEGAMDYIHRPFNSSIVKARVDNHIQLNDYRLNLEARVEEKTREINQLHTKMLDTFATIIEYRSLESGLHIQRTMELTKILVKNMLKSPKFRDQLIKLNYDSIIRAIPLHDIGKVGIPDSILLKPDRLTPEEFEIIKTHTVIGRDMLCSVSNDMKDEKMYLKHGIDIALCHHERWDGTGYPSKLSGEDIPLSARIMSVVDVYDALISKRCYKESFTHDDTIAEIKKGRGTQFDPDIVDSFLEVADDFMQKSKELVDV